MNSFEFHRANGGLITKDDLGVGASTQIFGDVPIEGVNEGPARSDHKHAMTAATRTDSYWIPPGQIYNNTTPAVPNLVGSPPDPYLYLAMADGATSGIAFMTQVPKDCSITSLMTFNTWYRADATDGTSHAIRWRRMILELIPGTTLITATGIGPTDFSGISRTRVADVVYQETASTLITGVPIAVGDPIRCSLERIGGDAADTYVGGIRILGIQINYTRLR